MEGEHRNPDSSLSYTQKIYRDLHPGKLDVASWNTVITTPVVFAQHY